MIYRDTPARVEGVWNRSEEWTSTSHVQIYADGGLNEVEGFLRASPRHWSVKVSEEFDGDGDWDLKAGWAGAQKMAREGWHEGVEMVNSQLYAMIPAAGQEGRWGYATSGGSVNISRYLAGHPNNMRSRRKRTMGAAPVLHLVVNGAASCMVTADQMANYGCALVGLVDRLENSGKRVHLDVVYAVMAGNEARLAVGWNVKQASEPVDLSSVAFSIGHPAAFRRLGFALMERSPKRCETPSYGYGADLVAGDVPEASAATMLIDGINAEPSRCNSTMDALRLAIEQLNKAAVIAGHNTVDDPLIGDDEY